MNAHSQLRASAILRTQPTQHHLLDEIRRLAPDIRACTAEIEVGRRIPADLIAGLKSLGMFRLFVPRSHGGLELDLPTGLHVIRTLARIDGSVAWCVMIASGGSLFAPLLPRETYDQIYRDTPDVVFAGSIQPAGTAEAVAGRWRIIGRWPFASGCQHADWLIGACTITEDGTPARDATGTPLLRGVCLPAERWQIEDTWHVAGLKGTGSHHISLERELVGDQYVCDLLGSQPCLPGPLYMAVQHMLPLLHAAVSVGIAEGALSHLVGLAKTGRQRAHAPAPMRDSESFQYELGQVAAELRAAEAMRAAQAESHWRRALDGTLQGDALLHEGAQSAIWIAAACVHVADACFALGGSSSVYDASPLQRGMRDLHVAAQHGVVRPGQYVNAGRHLLETGG